MYYYMHLHRKFHPDPLSGLKIRRGSIKDMFDCVINFKTEKSEPSRLPSSGAAVHRYDKTSQKQLFYTCRWIYLIKYWYWGLSIKWKVSEQVGHLYLMDSSSKPELLRKSCDQSFFSPWIFFVSESARMVLFDFQAKSDVCRGNLWRDQK